MILPRFSRDFMGWVAEIAKIFTIAADGFQSKACRQVVGNQ
jgi:hypothetical protein